MRDFSILKGRILQYLEMKGITKYTFYKVTGIANGILSQPNGISEENLLKFLTCFPDVNSDWLIRGEGPMLMSSVRKEGVFDCTGGDRIDDSCCVDDLQVACVASSKISDLEGKIVQIPIRQWRQAYCGEDLLFPEEEARICLPADLVGGHGVLACFRIEDQAMYPALCKGNYVVCRLLSNEQWKLTTEEEVCIVALCDGRILLRRLRWGEDDGAVVMFPDHPDRYLYPALRLMQEDIHLLWRVECHLSVVPCCGQSLKNCISPGGE